MRRRSALLLLALTLLACRKPSPTGVALDREIREPSGVVASPDHAGVYWVHGDSGTGNWLFAVDGEGRTLGRVRVKGAENVDWEDIAHDGEGRLWLGDIGNNDSSRRDLAVHRLPEPDPRAELDEVRVELSVPYSFPEQQEFGNKLADFDAEALMWWAGQLWLFTKHRSDDRTWAYRFPSLAGEPVELERGASFDMGPSLTGERKPWSGQATAADAAPDGRRWALLSYDAVFVFALPSPGPDAGRHMFDELVTRIEFAPDRLGQVEALTWDRAQLLLINEDGHVFRVAEPLTATQYP